MAMEAVARDAAFLVAKICAILDVSRWAKYAWRDGAPSPRDQKFAALAETVRVIFWYHRRRYGAGRIAAELAERGVVWSPRRVANVVKMHGLRAIQPKSFVRKTTARRHGLGYSPNLLLDAGGPLHPNRIWVGDLSYLPLRRGGSCYLAALMDRFTRDLAGWSVAATMEEPLVLAALRQAIRSRQPKPGLAHRTDHGGLYAGYPYRAVPRRGGMRHCISRAANCYDNASMERCFGTFKTEMETTEYESEEHARRAVADYVDYYRFDPKHSSLGYLTPKQFTRNSAGPKKSFDLAVKSSAGQLPPSSASLLMYLCYSTPVSA